MIETMFLGAPLVATGLLRSFIGDMAIFASSLTIKHFNRFEDNDYRECEV